jgi:hypothetical protein
MHNVLCMNSSKIICHCHVYYACSYIYCMMRFHIFNINIINIDSRSNQLYIYSSFVVICYTKLSLNIYRHYITPNVNINIHKYQHFMDIFTHLEGIYGMIKICTVKNLWYFLFTHRKCKRGLQIWWIWEAPWSWRWK